MAELLFTTSWDDGHPLDLRVADLLAAHGFRGTFYVPRRNVEGRSVLSKTELGTLASRFEIGGHTLDHVRLSSVPRAEAARQVRAIKAALAEELGREVTGFCYPGGGHSARIRQVVRAAGYRYARTIENLRFDLPLDPFQFPTTLQFYPHSRLTYLKNVARGGVLLRARGLGIVLQGASFVATLRRLLDHALEHGGLFHLWGHSWELEERGLWRELETFLAYAADRVPPGQRFDNAEVIQSIADATATAAMAVRSPGGHRPR